jgi:DMSO/TMAO reductase YedYZ molybdopterin-dependent catalytic subunit
MVFSQLHWVPSLIAAALVVILAFVQKPYHKYIAIAMAFFALLGLFGYLTESSMSPIGLNIHSVHILCGAAAFILSLYIFARNMISKGKSKPEHCMLGYLAAFLAFLSILGGFALIFGLFQQPAPVPLYQEPSIAANFTPTITEVNASGQNATLNASAGTPKELFVNASGGCKLSQMSFYVYDANGPLSNASISISSEENGALENATSQNGNANFTPITNGTYQLDVSLDGYTAKTLKFTVINCPNKLPETEAKEYQGVQLVSIKDQGNNAINGFPTIDVNSYRLEVTGLVNKNLNITYNELLEYPAYSEVAYMPCVEGWGFNAKWTGFRIMDLLNNAGLKPDATYVVFYAADGFSSGLPISYLQSNQTLMAYGLNDVTLPVDRGFPFQVVAKNKYGYKWVKWVVKIEVLNKEQEGYWESVGYNNNADVGGPTMK